MTMRKICLEAEAAKSFSRPAPTEPDSEEAAAVTPWEPRPIPHLGPICKAAAMMSAGCDAKLIVARTETGSTALMLSKQRPGIPILAISGDTHRKLAHAYSCSVYSAAGVGVCVPSVDSLS